MVFTNLTPGDKGAFFALMDEYFESRPHLFPNTTTSQPEGSAAASALYRGMASNPQATSSLISAGLKHGVPKNSPYAAAANNSELTNAFGRVAASSISRSSNPPPPVHRTPSNNSEPNTASSNLVSVRKFGDVDTSSAKNLFAGLRGGSPAVKNPVTPPTSAPSTFASRASSFAPPPIRTVTAKSPPEPQLDPVEPEGEWAETLYEYKSGDAGDLELEAKQRLLITERTSEDWWTGEAGGKKGLFPASYVKVI